jgi:hypothetical protein
MLCMTNNPQTQCCLDAAASAKDRQRLCRHVALKRWLQQTPSTSQLLLEAVPMMVASATALPFLHLPLHSCSRGNYKHLACHCCGKGVSCVRICHSRQLLRTCWCRSNSATMSAVCRAAAAAAAEDDGPAAPGKNASRCANCKAKKA